MPSIEEHVYPHADLPRELEIQIWDFTRLVWSDAIEGDARFRDRMYDEPPPTHFVRSVGSLLVSHVHVLPLSFGDGAGRVRVGGIGAVMTYPQFRGEGHASALLRVAAEHIAGTADVGMLFCDEETVPFYERLGWARPAADRIVVPDDYDEDVPMTLGDAAVLPAPLVLDWTW